ncbi:MAG: HAD family hydrolase [Actinomycetota bacterium]|nr:HAD family hydrolase [Actinomycetota bacterium]
MLRAALIDVGGTLWPDRWPSEARHLYIENLTRNFSLSPDEVDRLLAQLEARDPALVHPLPLVQDSSAMAADALAGADLDHIHPMELLRAMDLPVRGVIRPFDGAEAFLRQLKSLRIRTVIFSNATFRAAAGYRRDFDELGFGPYVDAIISSVDIGYRKPSREIFKAALDAAGCSPSDIVVVGDSVQKDILPALDLGMRTVLVGIEAPPPETSHADAVVTDLDQACAVISGWTQLN